MGTGGRGTHERLDRLRADAEEQPLEDGQIQALIAECKHQMACQIAGRRMSRGQQTPGIVLHDPMADADREQAARQRHVQPVRLDQRCIPRRCCGRRQTPIPEDRHTTGKGGIRCGMHNKSSGCREKRFHAVKTDSSSPLIVKNDSKDLRRCQRAQQKTAGHRCPAAGWVGGVSRRHFAASRAA